MASVGLIDLDRTGFPNLALMKLSAWLKEQGNKTALTEPLFANGFDEVYASKVFSWGDVPPLPEYTDVAGSGVNLKVKLPQAVECICPDYALYGLDYSVGFLTRGCINHCPWCIVPEKEGPIAPAADIDEFLRHDKAVLMDNNVLACDWGLQQIEKIASLPVRVDFNQGLDARLIGHKEAKLLAKVKWLQPIRLACDSLSMIPHVERAVRLLRWYNATPRRYSCYVLIQDDLEDALERIMYLKGIDVSPFAQPFIPPSGKEPPLIQKKMARWVNMKACFNSATWEEYQSKIREA